jgi:hypothetical protein
MTELAGSNTGNDDDATTPALPSIGARASGVALYVALNQMEGTNGVNNRNRVRGCRVNRVFDADLGAFLPNAAQPHGGTGR